MTSNMSAASVNPDLQSERNKASFTVSDITHILDGGKENTKRRKEIECLLFSDPVFRTKDIIYTSHTQEYAAAVEWSVKLYSLKRKLNWSDTDFTTAKVIIRRQDVLYLHSDVFIPALEGLATEEQKAKWLIPAKHFQIIGAYAQTEMGHGSNLQGLETTATYDPKTDEFVLHSPSLSSVKWWPGAMAKTSNFCVLMAQLVINDEKLGMQPFIVQLRRLEDHHILPGIELGYIGPKLRHNFNDNGYLFLRNVRIPRKNMLMKNAEVTREGKFISYGPSKANYSTMMLVRAGICKRAFNGLSYAATVAIRYSAVRRQSSLKPGTPEMKVLDYQTQQYKLFPAIASAYGLFFVSGRIMDTYKKVFAEIEKGDLSNLQAFHVTSSAMKALTADILTEYTEICRRSCGGHGYLISAGIPDYLLSFATPLVTVEGENTVLYLQVARYLLKQILRQRSSKKLNATVVMSNQFYTCPIQTESDCRNLGFLCDVYKKRAQGLTLLATNKVQENLASGSSQDIAMNNSLQPLVRAAVAHSYLLAVTYYVEGVTQLIGSVSVKNVLNKLCCLFAVHNIVKMSGEFLETTALCPQHLRWFENLELKLLAEIRPDAVALVDAFDVHDDTLCSALGSYDGHAYERLYESAIRDPMNKVEVDPSYHKYLRQLMAEGTRPKL